MVFGKLYSMQILFFVKALKRFFLCLLGAVKKNIFAIKCDVSKYEVEFIPQNNIAQLEKIIKNNLKKKLNGQDNPDDPIFPHQSICERYIPEYQSENGLDHFYLLQKALE